MAAPGVPQPRRVRDPSLADAINLSRLAAGRAVVISPLLARDSCGAYKSAVLGCLRVPVSAVRNLLLREFLTAIITADDLTCAEEANE